ncbi:hypothetical protein HMPREF1219_00466 [Corynebacterium pyruviciproducens ATCC BAA-1742]|uniref:Metallo-beta-lactamase domain-containing protein n=1 Tax=Corynebacterium pyruviciproducens ATCC BAA-1742 TaxID=1125779 RepID=S2ZK80_9CORY|nr:MBL fold metallo-hydrolase [Corynebacterium pyruviciproducens]EPD70437.1 hypothetical protein HMPREF1219_00466 [Corynebacterium pyruviciproducens ATCC BAA-1742]
MALRLHHISVSSMDNNCYLLAEGDKALLVDAAADAPSLLSLAASAGCTITAVLTTHRHHDHVGALGEILDATGATHYASALDAPALPRPVDHELGHGDTLDFEGHHLPVSILRGHTPGGAAIAASIDGVTHLFVGDSLFPGGVGKTTNPKDFQQLLTDVTERLFEVYPDDAIVHPGHGKPTTLGAERPHLAEWRERGW